MSASAGLPAEVRAFLEAMQVPGVLATLAPDGSPITSAVWYALDGDDVVISTPATRPKARNVRLDGRVSFVVDTKDMPYRGVCIEGTASAEDDPGTATMFAIARRYLGPDLPDRIRERAAMGARTIIRIRVVRVRPWNLGPG